MPNRSVGLVLLILAIVLAPPAAKSQDARGTPPQAAGALTPAQAQQALEVLQDDGKRTQLIQTLQAVAKASAQPASGSPADQTPSADNLGVQLLVQVSNWLGEVSGQLAVAARAVSDFPMVGRWLVQLATNPDARGTLLDAAWKLALVIACALAAEWIVWRVVRRPLAAIARYVPAARARVAANVRRRQAKPRSLTSGANPPAAPGLPSVALILGCRLCARPRPAAAHHFAAVGNLLLATGIGTQATPRVVILAIVNAYVLCRGILCVTAALVSPAANQPSLLVIRDETAAYIDIWVRRIVVVAVFGVALANIALLLGLYRPAYVAVVRLVVLVVHLFAVVVILQCRRNVADLIRAPESQRGVVALVRNRLADIWHVLAIALNLALWAVWALQVRNGYMLLLQYCLATIAVLVIARLLALAVMTTLDRLFRMSPDFMRQFPGLEMRANRYFPALRGGVLALISVMTVIALLEVWGIGIGRLVRQRARSAAAWFPHAPPSRLRRFVALANLGREQCRHGAPPHAALRGRGATPAPHGCARSCR